MEPESQQEIQQKKNPIRRAQKEKQFRSVGQSKDILADPQQVYEATIKYDKTFKTVKNEHPKHKDIVIIDFSLNARGPDEDEIYVKQPFYRNNIRRGNTLIYFPKDKRADILRKGLKKFFDISQASLKAIKEENVVELSKRDKYNHYAVFQEVENVLSCNEDLEEVDKAKVHVYRLNKANGENAQISFYQPLNEWVISSKNVAIMVKDQKDIKLYKGDRYGFAALIAEAWFKQINLLNKQQQAALKADLKTKTIIGEYCGNPDFQHLVKYAQTTIYFYAMVDNYSAYSCILPNQAFAFFERHRIPIVKNHQQSYIGAYTSFVELGGALLNVFGEVSRASIFEEEEGSVIYFGIEKPKKFCEYISDRYLQGTVPIPEKWEQKEVWYHVSSLGKLKTLEYRILRKLREKLKFFTRSKKKEDTEENREQDYKKYQEKYGSFEKQVYSLLKKQKLGKPIEYYFCAALLAFEYAYKNKKSNKALALMSQHYLDFLSVIFWCIEQKRPVTQEVMRDEQLHKRLRGETWQAYNTDIITQYSQLLQRIVPKYAKIKKSMKPEEVEEEGGMVQKSQEEV